MSDWPTPYVPPDDPIGSKAAAPSWSKARCIEAGTAVAKALVRLSDQSDSPSSNLFGEDYLAIVKLYYRSRGDRTDRYAAHIGKVAQNPDTNGFNEHDFANIHRAAWLKIVRALARLVALSPFIGYPPAPNPWADPVHATAHSIQLPSSHGDFVFDIPNGSGYYAITCADIDDAEGKAVGELVDGPFIVWPPDRATPQPDPRGARS